MLHLVAVFTLAVLGASGASAQERGWLAIGLESARHAFSFSGSADAVNACGISDCEVVETFTACLAVAYSSETASGRPVWTWIEAATEGDANRGAQDECEAAGGLACAVMNTYCLDGGSAAARQATPPATAEQETVFWQSIVESENPAMFEAYLAQFPNGVFRALAEARLAELREPSAPRPGTTRTPTPGSGSRSVGSRDTAVDSATVPPGIPADQVCTPQPHGDSCWIEVSHRPGCYVWNPNPQPNETVTWTGACADGFAQGSGTATWSHPGEHQIGTGLLRNGKTHGTWNWVLSSADGSSTEVQAEFDNGIRVR